MKWLNHLKTVTHHKKLVLQHCFRVGLYYQGITHDLSKFWPVPGIFREIAVQTRLNA